MDVAIPVIAFETAYVDLFVLFYLVMGLLTFIYCMYIFRNFEEYDDRGVTVISSLVHALVWPLTLFVDGFYANKCNHQKHLRIIQLQKSNEVLRDTLMKKEKKVKR